MRQELLVPVDGKISDWPRRVSNALRALAGFYDDMEQRIAELEANYTALESRVTDLETP